VAVQTVSFLPIEILMRNQSRGVEISGQKLWCGSAAVIEYLLHHPQVIQESVVLELGAGTGILGMICHKIGCRQVILTDNDERSLKHMSMDCPSNHVDAIIKSIDWFSFDESIFEHEICINGRLVIVAGDVLYKKALLEPFFNVVSALFRRFAGQVDMWLCHVPRADNKHEDVLRIIASRGLHVETIDPSGWRKGVCIDLSPQEDYDRAALYHITAPSG
jgi:ribosomal protein L11 methylase PrmA